MAAHARTIDAGDAYRVVEIQTLDLPRRDEARQLLMKLARPTRAAGADAADLRAGASRQATADGLLWDGRFCTGAAD